MLLQHQFNGNALHASNKYLHATYKHFGLSLCPTFSARHKWVNKATIAFVFFF